MEQVKTKSVEPHQRFTLSEVCWDELNEAGASVERGSGDLYRVPKEALIPGGSLHYPQGKQRRFPLGANQPQSLRDHPRSAAALCPTQH